MSLSLERKIAKQQKQIDELERKLNKALDLIQKQFEQMATDKDLVTKVLYDSMERYLAVNVEFHMSTEGQIWEILKDDG